MSLDEITKGMNVDRKETHRSILFFYTSLRVGRQEGEIDHLPTYLPSYLDLEFVMLPRPSSNSWTQAILLPRPPEYLRPGLISLRNL